MDTQKDIIAPMVQTYLAMGFDAFKKMEADKSRPWVQSSVVSAVSDMASKLAQGVKGITPEDIAERIQESVHLAGQYIITEMNKTESSWFQTVQNGDLHVRRVPAKDDQAPKHKRAEKACINHCFELSKKYGTVELAKAVLAVFSINKKVEEVFGTVPEKPINPLAQA
jgi:hypothetical protein